MNSELIELQFRCPECGTSGLTPEMPEDKAIAVIRRELSLRCPRCSAIVEVNEPLGAAIAEAMRAPIAMPAFALALGGLGMFPPRGAPRVLWIGAIRGGRETIELQRAVAERVTRTGVELERRPFHAHLTLGRWRDSGERDRRAVLEVADTGELARIEVDHVTLYQSRLSPHGATHTALVTTALRPEAPGTGP